MKFSLLNCLLLLVAIAALVAWRVDKSRFESTLTNYGEELPEPEWEIDGTNIFESFSIGDVTFIFLDSDIRVPAKSALSLSEIDHPRKAEVVARPSESIQSLIDDLIGQKHQLSFENATIVDYGDDGHIWKVLWSLYPSSGGFSGFPYQYIGIVRGDGSPVAPRVVLRDHFGSWYSNQQDMIFSVLPLDALPLNGDLNLEEHELVAVAQKKLSASLDELGIQTQFRFDSIIRRSFPGKLQTVETDSQLEVWAVDFVDQAIPANVKNENSATRITIWVTNEFETSEISVGQWTLESGA
jgi:hypothetical protein